MTDIKFGIRLPHFNADYNTIQKIAIYYDELGFDSIWLMDHMIGPSSNQPLLECWTTLSSLASLTNTIKLGSLVTCNSFRHPALLAKMVATLDNISNGRINLGLGAGWHESECKSYGIPFPKTSVRITALKESILLIKRMWTDENPSFNGTFYKVSNAICNPRPIQKPHPPIWVGGEGEKLLEVTAEVADGCNFRSSSFEEYFHRLSILKEKFRDTDRDLTTIDRSVGVPLFCSHNEKELETVRGRLLTSKKTHPRKSVRDMPDEEFLATRVIGTPKQCRTQIGKFIDAGANYIIATILGRNLDTYRLYKNEIVNPIKSEFASNNS
jgi:F420-dependent oxidoreductase-like protein